MTSSKAARPTESPDSALLIVDMISCWDFPDADKLAPEALVISRPIAAFKQRCREAGIPVIYANDNQGQWRSDFTHLVEASISRGHVAEKITKLLMPGQEDYFVLKPKHSAFFGTPLDMLLRHLKVHRLFIAGVSSDQCVLATSIAARMRDFDVLVPCDCVISQTQERSRAVLRQLGEVHGIKTPVSADIDVYATAAKVENHASTTG